jgi:hypothetical protein
MSAVRQKRAALTHVRSACSFSRTLKVRQLFEEVRGIIRTVITGAAWCFSAGHRPQIVARLPP